MGNSLSRKTQTDNTYTKSHLTFMNRYNYIADADV